ncbi:MAG: glycoside hydrolase family 28 protein [Bacteroidota bacterium]
MITSAFRNITEFGAIPDGITPSTRAFASAIESAAAAGGGTVYVPAGVFSTGPIHLKSNITLYLDAGARVRFSREPGDYPLVHMRWEGSECECYSPQIFGQGLENVAVMGRGVLDGQGEPWWQMRRENRLDFPRPRLIGLVDCRDVLIEGIKLKNSPSWTINPIRCENLTIDKVTITNPADSPNTDGIDPESCRNVHIANCHVDVGDDCIVIKAGKEDCTPRVPCENITITNCTMVHGHGGVVIGSEMSGGVRNVAISNCVFEGTDRGIRLKSRRGRGGVVEDIRVSNIVMRGVICPFVIHLFYHCGAGGKEQAVQDKNPRPVTDATPIFRRIHFSGITAREVSAAAGFIHGLPEMPVEEVTFDDISVHLAADAAPGLPAMMNDLEPMQRRGFYCCHARRVSFRNVRIDGHEGPAFTVKHSRELEFVRCPDVSDDPTPLAP